MQMAARIRFCLHEDSNCFVSFTFTHTTSINQLDFCASLRPIDVSSTGRVANSEQREHTKYVLRNKIDVKCRDRDPLVFIRFQCAHRFFFFSFFFFCFVWPLCRCICCSRVCCSIFAVIFNAMQRTIRNTKYQRCMRMAAVYFNFFSSSSHSNRCVFVSLRNLFDGEKKVQAAVEKEEEEEEPLTRCHSSDAIVCV